MRLKVLDKGNMPLLVESLMDNYQVIGPKAKGSAFAFESITDPADLRLDYDTTILPPRKCFNLSKRDYRLSICRQTHNQQTLWKLSQLSYLAYIPVIYKV